MSTAMADVIVWGTLDDPSDPTHDHTWYSAQMPADLLGCYDSEADYIADALKKSGDSDVQWASPVIVVNDPLGRYKRGCSTRSEFNGEDDPGHRLHNPATDYHANCEHSL